MVAKNEIKRIRSLHQKKYRSRLGLFLAEGTKLVTELLNSPLEACGLYASEEGILEEAVMVTEAELRKMSALSQPSKVLGVFRIPLQASPVWQGWTLALDGVRDPGNLGTLIRLADWFGVRQVLCSPDTVDCFNPKVLQATMGSIGRVPVIYAPLEETLRHSGLPAYGASMEGESVGGVTLPQDGILVLGSESHGLSDTVREELAQTVAIPSYGQAESLNVATAGAILLYELRRGTPGLTQK